MRALRHHWPEYLIELFGLAWIMFAALTIASLIWAAGSPLTHWIHVELERRVLMGVGMSTAVVLFVYSRWGQRSGAHVNPAVTLAFYVLGKIDRADALFYVFAQFIGGVLGVALATAVGRSWARDPSVDCIVTHPGQWGPAAAFGAEGAITFAMILLVLLVTNTRWNRYTPVTAGVLLALLILCESPISGTSMNPARSFGSALVAWQWRSLWIYFVAPPIGALVASLFYARGLGRPVYCAKLCHPPIGYLCIFRCGYRTLKMEPSASGI
jgi:aquaporin Z